MDDAIVQIGDPVLREVAKPVAKKDLATPEFKRLIRQMSEALGQEEYGVAIAAPQLGAPLRLFVVAAHVFKDEKKENQKSSSQKVLGSPSGSAQPDHFDQKISDSQDRIYINPEITRRSRKKLEMAEGCLSVRGQYGTVLRHEKVSLKAQDEHGKPHTIHASGLLAHIFQHECDHLDGVLFVDKAEHTEPWEEFKKRTQARKESDD